MSTDPTDDAAGRNSGDAHAEEEADTITSTMYFLPRSPKYLIEKPYTMRYAPVPISSPNPPPLPPSTSATLPPQSQHPEPAHSPSSSSSPSSSPSNSHHSPPPPPPSSSSSSSASSPASSPPAAAAQTIPQTNIEPQLHNLQFRNLRTASGMSYEKCGFTVATLRGSEMRYEDFADPERVEGFHGREVAECVREALGAKSVEVLDSVVRRRHPTWPIATGESYEFQQPASRAHIDHTYEAGCKIIRDVYGDKADAIIAGRWQCVNVWHPLRGPLVDWPLALCDASTVDFVNDTMPGDVVDREAVFENTQVHYNPGQRWYYLKDQLPEELLVFKNADSEEEKGSGTPGVPHASFDNPLTKESDIRRESVEFRVLALW